MASSSNYSTVHNPTVTLNNGEKMPVLGLGTWKGKPGEVESSVQIALRVGYRYRHHVSHLQVSGGPCRADLLRSPAAAAISFVLTRMMLCRHIDCAKAYQNQTGLGQALQDLYKEGKVSRKDFWLTTKLWNTDHAEVRKNCLESMKELQTEYLDLYLVHWPVTPHKGPALTPSMKVSVCLSSDLICSLHQLKVANSLYCTRFSQLCSTKFVSFPVYSNSRLLHHFKKWHLPGVIAASTVCKTKQCSTAPCCGLLIPTWPLPLQPVFT